MKNPTGCAVSGCSCSEYVQKVIDGTPTATCNTCSHGEGQHTGNNL